jgi:hypothetical protein
MTLIKHVRVVQKENIDIMFLTDEQIINAYCPSQIVHMGGCYECYCKLGIITCTECWSQKVKRSDIK